MRIYTLCEHRLGYRSIAAKYPKKNWKMDTVKLICKHIGETGSAVTMSSLFV